MTTPLQISNVITLVKLAIQRRILHTSTAACVMHEFTHVQVAVFKIFLTIDIT